MSVRTALTPARRAALWTVWWLAVAALAAGAVWVLAAPRAKIRIASDGSGYYVDPSPREYIEADLAYAVVCLVLAVVAALAVRRLLRAHPVAAVTGLAVGAQLAALIVWQVGKVLAPLDTAAAQRAKPGTIVLDALDVGAKGLLLLLPVAALATWLVVDLVTGRGQASAAPEHLPPTAAEADREPVPTPELSMDVQSLPPQPPSG